MLRPYQETAVAAVRAAYRDGGRSILLSAPTGSGKTAMGCAIVEGAIAKGRRVLWGVHRRELVAQARDRLAAVGVPAGVILAGEARRPELPIQVASVATIAADGEAPDDVDVLVWDEAHHATCTTHRSIREAYPALALTIGLTATPARGDGTALGDVFDRLVLGPSVAELVDLGALVPCSIIAPGKRSKTLARDPVEAYFADTPGTRAIAFTGTVVEAHDLAAAFVARGVAAEAIDGTTDTDLREAALARLASGETRVVVNCAVLTEGFDCPAIETIIIARGVSSWATWTQIIGRGLRAAPGKASCTVLDLRGHVRAFGLPTDPFTFSLEGKPVRDGDGKPESLRACKACGAVYRPVRALRACPRCGAAVPPPRRQETQAEAMAAVHRGEVATWEEKRTAFLRLSVECLTRGYKPAWVGVQYKGAFGAWPPWPLPQGARGEGAHA